MAWTGNAMCSHKCTTIVHQHLYNIKGAIYKSTAIVHRMVMAGEPRPPVLCSFSTGEHLGSCHKARGGSIFGPVVGEAAGLQGLLRASPHWNRGSRAPGLPVSGSHRQASVTTLIKTVHIRMRKLELGMAP